MKVREIQEKNNLQLYKKKQKLKEKGITLIALVVTIIILLILAGVTLNMALSGDGLFSRAKNAADKYKKAQEDEAILIDEMTEVKRISTAKELQQLATEVNEGNTFNGWTIILMNDIDLSSVCSESSGNSWIPIGIEHHKFRGTFDGNNKTISNLWIGEDIVDNFEGVSIGLFGEIDECEIKNLTIAGEINNSTSETIENVGGLVGSISNSLIQNIVNQVEINVDKVKYNAGGLSGWTWHSTFIDCENDGDITTNCKAVGGISSCGTSLTFKSCTNKGNLISSGYSRWNYGLGSVSEMILGLMMSLYIRIVKTMVH